MIESLITSKTRIKLLIKFFLNSETVDYLRNLESSFGDSTNSIRIELKRLEKAKLLKSYKLKNKILFRANDKHPLYNDIKNITLKHTGLQTIIENVLNKIGHLEKVYIIGDMAEGLDAKKIEMIIIGKNLDEEYLERLVNKTQKIIKRNIKYEIRERDDLKNGNGVFLLWAVDKNGKVLNNVHKE